MSTTPDELRARLHSDGWAVVELGSHLHERVARPWSLIDGLIGAAPELLEVQPIRAVSGGRSFASSAREAPLHTDSQHWRARPPELQLTACLAAAAHGGESVLLDGHALLDGLAGSDPGLHRALLHTPRRISFVFGEVLGPSAAVRGGRFVLTHSPRPSDDDPVAERLGAAIASMSPEVISLRPGQALLLDNHRVLHGRREFDDTGRALVRVLAWLDTALGPAPSWAEQAREVEHAIDLVLHGQAAELRRRFGLEDRPELDPRARAVLAMSCGAPPGLLAQRYDVAEPELYRWRDALLGGAAIDSEGGLDATVVDAALARVARLC
ncbi:MAG: TauD/TfdA family dioxygenase [Deltaproteobacteria bacterium]|nr:TauD/TfdA family dioxygenase [Nannocystaceae bacterium]